MYQTVFVETHGKCQLHLLFIKVNCDIKVRQIDYASDLKIPLKPRTIRKVLGKNSTSQGTMKNTSVGGRSKVVA